MTAWGFSRSILITLSSWGSQGVAVGTRGQDYFDCCLSIFLAASWLQAVVAWRLGSMLCCSCVRTCVSRGPRGAVVEWRGCSTHALSVHPEGESLTSMLCGMYIGHCCLDSKSNPRWWCLWMLSSLLTIFHLRNGLKAASTAYEGKKYADQWRASLPEMKPISLSLKMTLFWIILELWEWH